MMSLPLAIHTCMNMNYLINLEYLAVLNPRSRFLLIPMRRVALSDALKPVQATTCAKTFVMERSLLNAAGCPPWLRFNEQF